MLLEVVLVLAAVGVRAQPPTPNATLGSGLVYNYVSQDDSNPHGVHSWPVTYPDGCSGQSQSPVDIQTDHVRFVRYECPRVHFVNRHIPGKLTNTGLFAKFKPKTHDLITLTNVPKQPGVYRFQNMHPHHGGANPTPVNASDLFAGAEHTIDGHRFDGEVHLVFYNGKYKDLKEASHFTDGIAVIAIFVEIVPEDKLVDPRFSAFLEQTLPQIQKMKSKIDTELDITMFLERNCGFYTYHGSLTTPLCNESVTWMVLRDPIYLTSRAWSLYVTLPSRDGVNQLYGNFRNTMPTNGRAIEANFLPMTPRLPVNQYMNPLRDLLRGVNSSRARLLGQRARDTRVAPLPPSQQQSMPQAQQPPLSETLTRRPNSQPPDTRGRSVLGTRPLDGLVPHDLSSRVPTRRTPGISDRGQPFAPPPRGRGSRREGTRRQVEQRGRTSRRRSRRPGEAGRQRSRQPTGRQRTPGSRRRLNQGVSPRLERPISTQPHDAWGPIRRTANGLDGGRRARGQFIRSRSPFDWTPTFETVPPERLPETTALEKYLAYDRRGNVISHSFRVGHRDMPTAEEVDRRLRMASRLAAMAANGRLRIYP